MKRFNVVILAGSEPGPLSELTGHDEKALIPIHGRAMVEHVIDAFAASARVRHIVVVGSANLDRLPAMRKVRRRLPQAHSVLQNLLLAVGYVKHRLYSGASEHDGYVVSFCDAVFLTPEHIDRTLAAVEASRGQVVLNYVERATFEAAGLPTQRTYIPFQGKHYTGSTLYYVRSFSKLLRWLPRMAELRAHRKDPGRLLEIVGARGGDLRDLERALGRQLRARVRLLESPIAELGMDVDKPADLELAMRLLDPA